MMDLIVRSLIVGGLATGAAWLFERALRNAGLGVRHAWTFSLLATTTLPFLPRLFERTATLPVPVIALPALEFTNTAVTTAAPVDYALWIWVSLALIVAAVYAMAYVRLLRARRDWQRAVVADHDVDISDRFGPAIFGFIAPRIVVPRWVREAGPGEQHMIVQHEREHIEARDHLQLLLTLIATVAMPWNPFVWIQTRRLRFALEADCDQRVLAAIPDRQRYATLLVDVGSRQMGLFLTPALAEHRNGLERRINMLAATLKRNRLKACVLAVFGIGIMIVACESRLPVESGPTYSMVPDNRSEQRMKSEGTPPEFPTVGALIAKHYPPVLREAGIGGEVTVQARIYASGKVERVGVVKSSGRPELDAAAVNVLKDMALFPSRTTTGVPQNVVENFNLVFDPASKIVDRLLPTRRVSGDQAGPAGQSRVLPDNPTFTPFTEKPELANRDEVSRALRDSYPPVLRDAMIGGTVILWVLLDETGTVVKTQIKSSAGRPELDAAAQTVGMAMKFTPARNKAEPVPVWIALPIVFKTQ